MKTPRLEPEGAQLLNREGIKRMRMIASLAAGIAALLLGSSSARAGTEIAVDFNVGVPRIPKPALTTGTGFDVRLGKELGLGAARFTAEVCGGYMSLGSTVARGLAGLRFTVKSPIAPVLFAHVGYGGIAYSEGTLGGSLAKGGFVGGTAFDAGFALDLRPISLFGAGVHAIYNGIKVASDSPAENYAFTQSSWISLGAHGAIYF